MSRDNLCFWHEPPRQWIWYQEEAYHVAPWCVYVGGQKRANFETKIQAIELVLSLIQTFEEHTSDG